MYSAIQNKKEEQGSSNKSIEMRDLMHFLFFYLFFLYELNLLGVLNTVTIPKHFCTLYKPDWQNRHREYQEWWLSALSRNKAGHHQLEFLSSTTKDHRCFNKLDSECSLNAFLNASVDPTHNSETASINRNINDLSSNLTLLKIQ